MHFNQKNLFPLSIALAFATLTAFTACRKNAEEIIEVLTNDEAAEIVETAVSSRSAGLTMPVIDASQIVTAYLNSCNTPGDTTLNKSNSGNVASYNYVFNMDWLVTCNNLSIPQSAQVNIVGNGNFNTQRWTGNDVTAGSLNFTGLNLQSTEYTVNGTYSLEGDVTGALRRVSPTLNCVTELELVNLKVNKSTLKITGGNGTATVIATAGNGETKTLNATLVFNGDGTVTVTVNGHVHTF